MNKDTFNQPTLIKYILQAEKTEPNVTSNTQLFNSEISLFFFFPFICFPSYNKVILFKLTNLPKSLPVKKATSDHSDPISSILLCIFPVPLHHLNTHTHTHTQKHIQKCDV